MAGNKNWDAVSRINHWLVAFVMIAMVVFGIYLEEFVPRGPEKGALIGIHKSIGVLVLLYGIWRVGYRLAQGFLEDASPMPRWQAVSAKVVHWVLLVLVIALPLSGILASYFGGREIGVFGLFTVPAASAPNDALSGAFMNMHGAMGKVILFALVLHVLGALKHHFFEKDTTLKRMLGRA